MAKEANADRLLEVLEGLRQELGRLSERVAALEAAAKPAACAAPPMEPLSDELLTVIGAAVAAFLGKRGHIRQIQLLGSAAWAQQGRAIIQASHGR